MSSLHFLERHRRIRGQLARDASVDIEHRRQRTALDHLREHAACIEADGSCANGQRAAVQLEPAADDVRGAHELTETDDRGVAQAGDRRNAQAFKRAQPILAGDSLRAEGQQVVGEEHRGSFAEPIDARLAIGVFEGEDQVTARRGFLGAQFARSQP
jgi:hypothetical protein